MKEIAEAYLGTQVNDTVANAIIAQLLFLESQDPEKDVYMYINSPGGVITAGMAIYDTMQYIDCDVATYCVGLAASAGALLVAGGTAEKRYMLPHAKMMIHQPWGGVGGQVSDIEIQAKDILQTRETLNQIMARHTGQTVEQIAIDTDRDNHMTATEAKEYGLVDEILIKEEKKDEKKSDEKSDS